MNVGTVIRKYRKEKGMTQEEMANRLGVTTPAVNKWENGATLPDITMLAPIARLLGISLDTLLSYKEELSEAEIREVVNELWNRLNGGASEQAFAWAKANAEEYPNCYALLLWMAQALDTYFTVMPQDNTQERQGFVRRCYERALDSGEEHIRNHAADALFHSALRQEHYDQAEAYLTYFSVENPERKRKQALLYSKTGCMEEACKAYEELLFTGCQTARVVMQNLYSIAVQAGDMERAKLLAEKHCTLVRVFDMGAYNEAATLLEYGVDTQDAELTLSALEQVFAHADDIGLFVRSPLYAHMEFNAMEPGYGDRLRCKLKEGFRADARMDFIKDDPRWKQLME